MDLQGIHSTSNEPPIDPRRDEASRQPHEHLLPDAATRHAAALLRRADEWDEWKSVRDVA